MRTHPEPFPSQPQTSSTFVRTRGLVGAAVLAVSLLTGCSGTREKRDGHDHGEGGAATNAPSEGAAEAKAVARLGDVAVTEPALSSRIRDYGPHFFPTYDSVKAISQAMLDEELLVSQAGKEGLLADGKLQRRVDEYRRQLIVSELLAAHSKKPEDWSADEVAAFFDQNRALFGKPERVKIARVPFSLADRSRAEAALKEAKQAPSFATVVEKYGVDPAAKAKGGELEPFARGASIHIGDKPFDMKKPGEVGLFESKYELNVVKLIEKLPADVIDPKAPEVERQIRQAMSSRDRDRWKAAVLAAAHDAGAPSFDEARLRALAGETTSDH